MDKAKVRQRYVLGRMLADGKISNAQYNAALAEEIKIVSDRPEEAKDGQEVCDMGNNFLKKLFKNDGDAISLLGWNIQTTIDIRVQSAAKKALEDDLAKIAKRNRTKEMPQGAVVVMNADREVLAMVGGAPYKPGELNRALDAQLAPGSAFKGLVYSTAFEKAGMGPNDTLSNVLTDYWDTGSRTRWTPGNYRGEASDIPIFNIRNAFAESLNIPAVKTICGLRMDVVVPDAFMMNGMISTDFCRQHGIVKEVIETAELAGIKFTAGEKKSLNPSIALGTHPVTPIGLLGAYMAIGFDGNYVQPKFFMKIEGENAPSLPEQEVRRVVSPETVAKDRILTLAVTTEGTGRKANGAIHGETIRGKTGTTNNSTNTWFICYDDTYFAVAWVGYDNGRSLGKDETGASAALPVCVDALRAAHDLEGSMVKAMRQQPKAEAEESALQDNGSNGAGSETSVPNEDDNEGSGTIVP
jgi:penicillin-binding protein 1A